MTYSLAIGDRTFSSWSLRGWLLFSAFGIEVRVEQAPMYTDAFAELLARYAPARLVPAMRGPQGVVWDSLAIAETLAEAHPDAGHWPRAPALRAMARAMTAEMHSGFTALRSDFPMRLDHGYRGVPVGEAAAADLARLETLWARAREAADMAPEVGAGTGSGAQDGGWLFGAYTAADAFFAPVAARIAAHDLPVSAAARRYVMRHLGHGPFRRWRAMGLAENRPIALYDRPWPQVPWPGPVPVVAEALAPEAGPAAVNVHCPFSGAPVVAGARARIAGQVVGFCNRFCRDKVVADPACWPEVMALPALAGAGVGVGVGDGAGSAPG